MTSDHVGKLVVVGWDGVSWDVITPLLDRGELPNLARLIEQSVLGQLATHGPLAEAVVYNSIATGQWADKHGILGAQGVAADGTIYWADSRARKTKAFWQILSESGRRCHVVHFPATAPAEVVNGVFVAPGFFHHLPQDYRQEFVLPAAQIHPADQAEGFRDCIVSLKEIDAETMGLFVPQFQHAPQPNAQLGRIAGAIARTLSVHAVATRLIEQGQWDVVSVNYPAIEMLWGEFLQRRAPVPPWMDPKDGELFGEVADSAVRLCDLLLGRVLDLAGEGASVMVYTPRSYVPNDQLPPPLQAGAGYPAEAIYRGSGMLIFRSPGVRADQLIHGARHLDLCPTILHLAGAAAGEDMDGRVLTDAFIEAPEVLDPVVSWSDAAGPIPQAFEPTGLTTPLLRRVTEQIATENQWRRVRTLLVSGRTAEGLALLIRLYYTNPLQTQRCLLVSEALFLSGLTSEAMAMMAPIAETFPASPSAQFLGGMVALFEGDAYRALDAFEEVTRKAPPFPHLYYYLGQAYMLTDRPAKAVEAFQRSVALNEDFPPAHVGLAQAHYRLGDYEQSIESASRSAALHYGNPVVHLLLAQASEAAGDIARAKQEYTVVLTLDPKHELAREALTNLGVEPPPPCAPDPEPPGPGGRKDRHDEVRRLVQEAHQAVAQWQSDVTDALASAEEYLDEYLQANAAARGKVEPTGAVDIPPDQGEWVIRPALPADQPMIGQVFPDAFKTPHELSVYVMHPAGTDDLQGALTVRTEAEGKKATLAVAVRGQRDQDAPDALGQWQMWRLLRAGVARAAAGGAQRVAFTFDSRDNPDSLRRSLERLGFEVTSDQTVWSMSMAAFRDRCLGLVDRYRKRKSIPEDVRLVTLGDVPFKQADQFLREFFPDGAGRPLRDLYPPVSRVMLKGDQIIACFVGFKKNPETFTVTRLGVSDAFRGLWVTPWLLGDGSKKAFEEGHTIIEFYTDEERHPDFVKIARGMKAEQLGTITYMALDLVALWLGGA